MHDTLRFWLDRGVDGFRADVINMIGKEELLTDLPPTMLERNLCDVYHHTSTFPLLQGIRRLPGLL